MNIGEAIRKNRKEYNFTQQKLADHLRISRTTISSWETGRTYPDLSMLIALSEVFNVSVDSLLKEDEAMVNSIDKDVEKGKRLNYYLTALLTVGLMIGLYFFTVTIKKKDLYENVSGWSELGGSYLLNEGDTVYMIPRFDTLDVRKVPSQLNIIANRSNDENSQITMVYNGEDSNIQVDFRSGPIEGMSINFSNQDFTLNELTESSSQTKYSYELRKYVNAQLSKEHSYLEDTFKTVKNKWKEINGI